MNQDASPPPHLPMPHTISVENATRLIRRQFPQYEHLSVRPLAAGWDNVMVRLGDKWMARFPRRALGAENLANEIRWLPVLAETTGLPVPAPLHVGAPMGDYPYPFTITRYAPGTPFGLRTVGVAHAHQLLAFLQTLHVPCPADVPSNPARASLLDREAQVREQMGAERGELVPLLDAAVSAAPFEGPPVWVHGDLHPMNVLVESDSGSLSFVDWGDVFGGDPAVDYASAWMLLEPEHLPILRSSVSVDLWKRARGWAVYFCVVLARASVEGAGTAFGDISMRIHRCLIAEASVASSMHQP